MLLSLRNGLRRESGVWANIFAGAITALVFYAEYVSLGAMVGPALGVNNGAALGSMMAISTVCIACLGMAWMRRPMLAGPRAASLTLMVAGVAFSGKHAHSNPHLATKTAMLTIVVVAGLVQLLGCMPRVRRAVASWPNSVRKGFMYATGLAIIVGAASSYLEPCLAVQPLSTALIILASLLSSFVWQWACVRVSQVRLGSLSLIVALGVAWIGYAVLIAPHAVNGMCPTFGAQNMDPSVLASFPLTSREFTEGWNTLGALVWASIVVIGITTGIVMLIESLTTLSDAGEGTAVALWPGYLTVSAATNIIAGPLGLCCSSLSTSRTNLMVSAHASNGLACVIHALALAAFAFLGARLLQGLPTLCVGISLILVALQMIDQGLMSTIWAPAYRADASAAVVRSMWIVLAVAAASVPLGMGSKLLGMGYGTGSMLALACALAVRSSVRALHRSKGGLSADV